MSDMFNVWGAQMRHERNCKPIMQKQIFATLEFRVCGFPLAFYLLEGITSDFTQPIRKFRRLENRCPTWFNAWGATMKHARNYKPAMQNQLSATPEFPSRCFPLAFHFLRATLPTSTQPKRKFRRFENQCVSNLITWFGVLAQTMRHEQRG